MTWTGHGNATLCAGSRAQKEHTVCFRLYEILQQTKLTYWYGDKNQAVSFGDKNQAVSFGTGATKRSPGVRLGRGRGGEGQFRDGRNILCLDRGGGYMRVCVCQN